MQRKGQNSQASQVITYRCQCHKSQHCTVIESFSAQLADELQEDRKGSANTPEEKFAMVMEMVAQFLPCWRCWKGQKYVKGLPGLQFKKWERYLLGNLPYSHSQPATFVPPSPELSKFVWDSVGRTINILEEKGLIESHGVAKSNEYPVIFEFKKEDIAPFLIQLKEANDEMSKYLKKNLPSEIRQKIDNYQAPMPVNLEFKEALADEIRNFLRKRPLKNKKRLAQIVNKKNLQARIAQLTDFEAINRFILQSSYPHVFRCTLSQPRKSAAVKRKSAAVKYTQFKLTPLGDCVRKCLGEKLKTETIRWEKYIGQILHLLCLPRSCLLEEFRSNCKQHIRNLTDLIEDPLYWACEKFYRSENPTVIYGHAAPFFQKDVQLHSNSWLQRSLSEALGWDYTKMPTNWARIYGCSFRQLLEIYQAQPLPQEMAWLEPVLARAKEYQTQTEWLKKVVQAIDKAKLAQIQEKGILKIVEDAQEEFQQIYDSVTSAWAKKKALASTRTKKKALMRTRAKKEASDGGAAESCSDQ